MIADSYLLSNRDFFCSVFEIGQSNSLQDLGSVVDVGLLSENDFKHGVVYSFENFHELSHVAGDFFGVVRGAIHFLEQVKVHCDFSSNRTFNFDPFARNFLDLVVSQFGKVLAHS